MDSETNKIRRQLHLFSTNACSLINKSISEANSTAEESIDFSAERMLKFLKIEMREFPSVFHIKSNEPNDSENILEIEALDFLLDEIIFFNKTWDQEKNKSSKNRQKYLEIGAEILNSIKNIFEHLPSWLKIIFESLKEMMKIAKILIE